MPKKITEFELLPLYRKYITDLKKGKYLQKNGKRLRKSSIENYKKVEKHLVNFSLAKDFHLRIKTITNISKKQFENEKKYWRKFYHEFTGYMYYDLNSYDNSVGRRIKLLRAFFNYLINEKGLNIGSFHKNFFVAHEEPEIIVFTPERLNYLIYSSELNKKLSPTMIKAKDVIVFGCTVGLRFTDLMNLSIINIEYVNDRIYIKKISAKTQTYTRIKLPDYAVEIINKYNGLPKHRLLPHFNITSLNHHIKHIAEIAGWTEPMQKTRHKRGIPHKAVKRNGKLVAYRFCDLVTSHTMRRTAITTLLSLGMNEQMVRGISGHAANSLDFYRYVSFAQGYIDEEIDMAHEKLRNKKIG